MTVSFKLPGKFDRAKLTGRECYEIIKVIKID